MEKQVRVKDLRDLEDRFGLDLQVVGLQVFFVTMRYILFVYKGFFSL